MTLFDTAVPDSRHKRQQRRVPASHRDKRGSSSTCSCWGRARRRETADPPARRPPRSRRSGGTAPRPAAVAAIAVAVFVSACGSDSPQAPRSPAAPTTSALPASAVPAIVAPPASASLAAMCVGFDSGLATQSVPFPPRNEPFAFRQQLESVYQVTLRRGPTSTYVDIEGDIVWTQEYLRYRLSNCTHAQAVSFVLLEIDGAPGPADCGGNAAFPPRNEPFDRAMDLAGEHSWRSTCEPVTGPPVHAMMASMSTARLI